LFVPIFSLWGQRGYPRIETVYPGAVARGASIEVMLTGRYNLRESTRVLFERPGITGTVIEWQDLGDTKLTADKRQPFEREGLRIKVQTAADVTPGIYGFRILTKGSLSALAHMWWSAERVSTKRSRITRRRKLRRSRRVRR
jgi:hypothetical protein